MDTTIYMIAFAGLICFLLWKNRKTGDKKEVQNAPASLPDRYGTEKISVYLIDAESFYGSEELEGHADLGDTIDSLLSGRLDDIRDSGGEYFVEFNTLGSRYILIVIHIKPVNSGRKGGLGSWTWRKIQ